MADGNIPKSSTDIVAAILTAAIVAKGADGTVQNAVAKFWEVRAGLTGRHRPAPKN